jgi:minor capsid protein
MNALLDGIAGHLVASGIAGGATTWPIHKLVAQDEPDQIVAIYPTGGPEPLQATDRAWREPTVQVMARGKALQGSQAAADKAEAILLELDRAQITGFVFLRATQSGAVSISTDDQGRARFVVNFRAGEA